MAGEVWGLAKTWGWGDRRRNTLQSLLDELVFVSAGEAPVIDAYSELYALLKDAGKPIGDNDLWIAATAKAADATVLTLDSDFERLPAGTVSVERIQRPAGHRSTQKGASRKR